MFHLIVHQVESIHRKRHQLVWLVYTKICERKVFDSSFRMYLIVTIMLSNCSPSTGSTAAACPDNDGAPPQAGWRWYCGRRPGRILWYQAMLMSHHSCYTFHSLSHYAESSSLSGRLLWRLEQPVRLSKRNWSIPGSVLWTRVLLLCLCYGSCPAWWGTSCHHYSVSTLERIWSVLIQS